jgi:hypothetical protein
MHKDERRITEEPIKEASEQVTTEAEHLCRAADLLGWRRGHM